MKSEHIFLCYCIRRPVGIMVRAFACHVMLLLGALIVHPLGAPSQMDMRFSDPLAEACVASAVPMEREKKMLLYTSLIAERLKRHC